MCGAGPLEEWCREQAEGLNIKMMGPVPNEEAKKLMAHSQALMLPTLLYEGFPMTIIEAYSSGTPVICSDLGNVGSVVEEGVTGWKFKVGDAQSLIGAIGRWNDIRLKVITAYKKGYTSHTNYCKLKFVYDEVSHAG